GLSHARNAGLKVAQGELIIFTDDDVFPCPDWLSIYWKAYVKNSKQCFFGGPVESVYEGEKPDQGLLKWAPASVQGLDYGNEERFINSDEAFLAANWACSREALNKVGGFDPNLGLNPALNEVRTGEEKDIMNRLLEIGCQGLYLPQAKIGHFVPNDKCQFKHIMARREAYGREVALEHMKTYDGKFFMDTPLWIYKKLAQDYIQLLSNKISHKETYDVHASLYYIKGMTKEIQNIRKRR
ncbi:MAG: glycosyltransferase, partial [Candidatus Omnitrophica bacterium]|nr:glycosyltransferase [Candidatus Omnitrophota bacterium]